MRTPRGPCSRQQSVTFRQRHSYRVTGVTGGQGVAFENLWCAGLPKLGSTESGRCAVLLPLPLRGDRHRNHKMKVRHFVHKMKVRNFTVGVRA